MPQNEVLFRFTTDHAVQIYQALKPELSDEVNPRSITSCWLEGPALLVLKVESEDVAALRAALNMYLRLINVADEIQDLVKKPDRDSGVPASDHAPSPDAPVS